MPHLVRKIARFLAFCVIAIAIAAFSSSFWLPWIGDRLVLAGPPVKAEAIAVLAGDSSGNRIIKAAQLIRDGYAPFAIVSGPTGFYGQAESDLAIAFVVKRGFPEATFIGLPNPSRSTIEEARYVLAELERRHIQNFLLVTSDTHTRRAGGIYRGLAKGMDMSVVAAPATGFTPHDWWREREGRKAVLFEWMKTVATWWGL